jgi:DNA-directed RNA polymerase specialized sigma24 family protein
MPRYREYRPGESLSEAEARWEAEAKQRRAAKNQQEKATKHLQAAQKKVAAAEQVMNTAKHEYLTQMVAAHQAGLSYAEIAAAVGMSKSRVHQLVTLTATGYHETRFP